MTQPTSPLRGTAASARLCVALDGAEWAVRCSYPKYAGARGLRCRVSEGDALYTPSYWNHAVYSPPAAAERGCVNIGVNYW